MAIAPGTWGQLGPLGWIDFGLTEKYAPWLGKNSALSKPQSIGQQSGLSGTVSNPTYDASKNQTNMTPLAVNNVLGASSVGPQSTQPIQSTQSTGQNNFAPSGSSGPNSEDLAISQWMAALENAKGQANSLRSQGESTFNNLLKSINDFRNRSQEQFTNAGQQITNTASDVLGGNARLGQSARTQAVNQGRAYGLGDSSKMGLMNQVTAGLAGNQGQALARKGENERSNQLLLQERQDQAQGQEDQANTYRTGIQEQAGQLERTGIQNAGFDFAGMLDNIRNQVQGLAQMKALNSGTLSAYTPNFSGLNSTLNTLGSGLANSAGAGSASAGAGNLSLQPANIQDLIKQYYQ